MGISKVNKDYKKDILFAVSCGKLTKSRINSKKASLSMSFLITILIPLITFVLVAPLVANYVGDDESKIEQTCKATVELRAASALRVEGADFKTTPIVCQTINKKIKPKDKKDLIKQVVEKMGKCWWMFGEGRYQKNIFSNQDIFGGESGCFTCYTLMIDETSGFSKTDDEGVTINELKDYLLNTKHPKLNNYTYMDYFQNFRGGKGLVMPILFEKEGIKPGRSYAIGYKTKKDKCAWCDKANFVGGVATGFGAIALAAGAVIGAPISIPMLVLVGGGVALTAISTKKMIIDEFFQGTNVDTIYLVDLADKNLNYYYSKNCEEVKDSASK